jgi:LDH2 family malate/lactate/ureidoglycolate dehydrogenase
MATDVGMIGMGMTQSYPTVAPFGGRQPLLGNAPIAFGIPGDEHDPVILDLSLTQTSSSGVKLAAQQGRPVAEGFILDADGQPTTDASAYPASGFTGHDRQLSRGSLTALGNSHKGYGLVFVVGLLTTVLADASAPWEVGDVVRGVPSDESRYGALFIAIDPARFSDDLLGPRVDDFIDAVKSSPPRDGVEEILYPGERSQQLRRRREEADAFAMPASHYAGLRDFAAELGLGDLLPD